MSQVPPPPPPYGASVPPPYGAPQPAWDLGSAVSWAWAKFQQNLTMIVGALLLLVVVGIVDFAGQLVIGALTSPKTLVCDNTGYGGCHWTAGTPFLLSLFLTAVLGVVVSLLAQIMVAGLIRGSLRVTAGGKFDLSDLLPTDKLGDVVVTALIVAAATFVGTLACVIPGIIVSFLLSYSLYFVLDKDMAPMDAVKASLDLTRNNLGTTIIWYIVGALIAVAGLIACCVGILATIPIVLLGTAYTYKKLTGQEVVA